MKTNTTIRFATLLKHYGPVKRATQCQAEEWKQAVSEKRFGTVYHGESDFATPLEGVVAHHGCVNTLCKLVFARPLPPDVERIIGMRDSQEAFDLCHH
jgi:hypothetical protein